MSSDNRKVNEVPDPTGLSRRDPFRVFFPLGILLAWAGIAHWVLHWSGVLADYRPAFHAITQIQGFMMAFAAGFLMTALPRRTGNAPPAVWEVWSVAGLLAATVVAAWLERFDLSQVAWLSATVVLLRFASRRIRRPRSPKPLPASFVWIVWGLLLGVVGSLATAAFGILGADLHWLHTVGKLHVLQGMFLGLIAGIGGMVLPLVTHGNVPDSVQERGLLVWHVLGLVLLVASFWVEPFVSLRLAMALRCAATLVVLSGARSMWRLPRTPGFHRKLVWVATWMLPVGFALGAAFPAHKHIGLHVVFIGGFALMALAISMHVTHAHAGDRQLMGASPRAVVVMAGALVVALLLRIVVELDRAHYLDWIAGAATAFLVATVAWGVVALPVLLRRPR